MFFNFTGKLNFDTSEDAKRPFKNNIKSEKGTGLCLRGTIESKKGNRAWIDFFGWKNSNGKIVTFDNDGNKIEIDYKDREDQDVIKEIPFKNRNIIDDGNSRHEFISSYDFAEYIEENVDEFKDNRYTLSGNISKTWKDGKEYTSFSVNNMYKVEEDSKKKNKLEITAVVYFTKDSIDTTEFKSEKKIYINGYTEERIRDQDKKMFVPQQFILDCSKIDFDNDDMVSKVNFSLLNLGLNYKDGKIENKLKSSKYYSNEITISYYNGAQDMGDAEDITYDMLTEMQKMKVDLGLAEPKDFAAKGKVYGNFITEYRIIDFPDKGKFEDGMVILEDTVEEFEDNIYNPTSFNGMPKPTDDDEEEEEKPKKKTKEKKKETETEDDEKPPFDIDDDDDDDEEKPKKKKKAKEPEPESDDEDDDDDDIESLFGD